MSDEAKAQDDKLVPLRASSALASGEAWKEETKRWAAMIRSGALPKHVDTPEKAITIARMGEIYGWDAMRALRSIYLVEGRPEMSAESMLSLIREKCPEAEVYPVEMSPERVVMRVRRPPQAPEHVTVTVTIEQFQRVEVRVKGGGRDKLTNRDAWKNYPEDMLWARCVSRIARRFFPDVIAGAYTIGEIQETEGGYSVRQVTPVESSILDGLDEDQKPEVEPEDDNDPGPPEDWTPGQ